MFRYALLCGLSVIAIGGAAAQTSPGATGQQQKTETGAPVNQMTRTFIRQAAEGGQFEIQSSEIAQQRAESSEVKSFARKIIDDHTEANKNLAQTARQAGTTVPEPTLAKKHTDIIADLRKKSGAQFDRTYVEAQVDAHQEAVQLFDDYSKKGDNAQFKQFATTTLPKLRQHLDLAKELKQSVGGAATGTGTGSTGGGTPQKKQQ